MSRLALAVILLGWTMTADAQSAQAAAVEGFWLGSLQLPSQSLRIQITLAREAGQPLSCKLDSLDQRVVGLPCTLTESGAELTIAVPAVRGTWTGKLGEDAQSLNGTWNQGTPLPLVLQRQRQALTLPTPKIAYSPALAPASAAALEGILTADLAHARSEGLLAHNSAVGITVGYVRNGERHVLSFGAAKADSLFEIGSITKTFTGLLLAQMVAQGKVQLDSPLHEFLPAGTAPVPAGAEITLLDLITQHSGLPRLPDNLHPADPTNPYADYGTQQLYQFLATHGLAKPADAGFLYSNLGVGLLGQLLANRAQHSYADLIQEQIAAPLRLRDTTISLSPDQSARFMQGLGSNHAPSHAWDLTALAGAGALRSTAPDMLTYLQANLHPAQFAADTGPGRTLPAAVAQSHQLRADAGHLRIAFAWLYDATTGTYWHNGGTGGFTSYAFFNPQSDYAAVVLVNAAPGDQGSFADSLGQHIAQRFAGVEALSLADW